MGASTSAQAVLLGGQLPAFLLDFLVVGLSTGLVGSSILDRLRGDDGEDDADDEDPLLDDDGLGGDLGDEFGEFGGDDDDWGDDPFGGMDEEGEDGTAELQNRMDELENEVATLSSTVGTVRGENEQISETVEGVEEDVRQLLDIYEMVTRGINPFVDDAAGFGGDGLDGGSFGLFDDDEGEEEELDPDVATADAEGFFDEELVEPSDEDPFAGEEFDGEGDATDTTEDDDMATDDTTGGKSFEELKAEYDSGDADWAEGDDDEAPDASFEGSVDVGVDEGGASGGEGDEFGDLDEAFDEPLDDWDDGFGDEVGGDAFETTVETGEVEARPDATDATDAEPDEPPSSGAGDRSADVARNGRSPGGGRSGVRRDDTATPEAGRATTGTGFDFLADDDVVEGPQRPYLDALPGGYVTDLLVMEWLEFLVEESTVTDAARAVNYYHRIGWVAEPVSADLREFLTGFGAVDLNRVNDPGCEHLTPEHHQKSLKYVMQLSGSTAESLVVDRWDSLSGVGRGL